MAQPVLVKSYTGQRSSTDSLARNAEHVQALPPVASYAFTDILRSADNADFRNAIDGIAEICAKNRMSLADEYASHLPPLGEITAATSSSLRPHVYRPAATRRALTSVPEASSSSSEGSRKSKKRASIFSFRKQQVLDSKPVRRIRIGSMGRTIPVGTSTAVAAEICTPPDHTRTSSEETVVAAGSARPHSRSRSISAAEASLQRLLARGNEPVAD